MPIPRIHLFEFTDQNWLPALIRDFQTDYLNYLAEKSVALYHPATALVRDLLRETNQSQIVDLCSGAGGPALRLGKELAADGVSARVTLTDRFPHASASAKPAAESLSEVSYCSESVDARAVPAGLAGPRTCFNGFHHFRPKDAIAILRNAAQALQGIGIFEGPERQWRPILANLVLVPLVVLWVTPFIRPVRLSRLLLTYLLPVVPLVMWWDGVVSQLRAYSAAELEQLALAAEPDAYKWRAGRIRITASLSMTYLTGSPKVPDVRRGFSEPAD